MMRGLCPAGSGVDLCGSAHFDASFAADKNACLRHKQEALANGDIPCSVIFFFEMCRCLPQNLCKDGDSTTETNRTYTT